MHGIAKVLCILAAAAALLSPAGCSAKNERKRASAGRNKTEEPAAAAATSKPAPTAAKPPAQASSAPATAKASPTPAPQVVPAVEAPPEKEVPPLTLEPAPPMFTVELLPRIVCTEAAQPLAMTAACLLTGTPCRWGSIPKEQYQLVYPLQQGDARRIEDPPEGFSPPIEPGEIRQELADKCRLRSAEEGFGDLIEGRADVLLAGRNMLPDETDRAVKAGLELSQVPIALDALVVLVRAENPVGTIAPLDLQNIFAGEKYNWSTLGGNNVGVVMTSMKKRTCCREMMNGLVMAGKPMADAKRLAKSMAEMAVFVSGERDAIGFGSYYFMRHMAPIAVVKSLAVDGVAATPETIREYQYPYVTSLYVVKRGDVKAGSAVEKFFDWLRSGEAQTVIRQLGYVPAKDVGR